MTKDPVDRHPRPAAFQAHAPGHGKGRAAQHCRDKTVPLPTGEVALSDHVAERPCYQPGLSGSEDTFSPDHPVPAAMGRAGRPGLPEQDVPPPTGEALPPPIMSPNALAP